MQKKLKERMDMFMVEKSGKEIKNWIGIHKKRKGNLKKKQSMTSLPC